MSLTTSLSLYENIYCPECFTLMNVAKTYNRVAITHPITFLGHNCSRKHESISVRNGPFIIADTPKPYLQVKYKDTDWSQNCPDCGYILNWEVMPCHLRIRFFHVTRESELTSVKSISNQQINCLDIRPVCHYEMIKSVAQFIVFI